MVLPYINMHLPQVYTCSASWTLLPPPSPYHPSGSSQCTSPKHPVSCIEPELATHFIYDIIHVSMPFSQINRSILCAIIGTGNKCITFCFIYFCFIDYTKAFDFVDHNKLWKILLKQNFKIYQPHFRRPKLENKQGSLRMVDPVIVLRERVGWFGRMALKYV